VVYNSLTDQELVTLLKQGDRLAFTEIYRRYKGVLYIFGYKRIREREETRDVIHELFASLWNRRETLPDNTNLLPYLYTAIKNKIMDLVSRQKVAARYVDQFQEYINTTENTTDHLVRHRDLLNLIEQEIAELPKKMRQVFELSRQKHLTHKEIAEELGISEQTVKSHLHHALKLLKSRLGPFFILLFEFLLITSCIFQLTTYYK